MKESEVRPQALFNRYLEVARGDIERFFSDKQGFVGVACPACSSDDRELAFEKLGFHYQSCRGCGSLYVSPRPTSEMIDHYYREGAAVKFWSTDFYRETAEARREKIFTPRAELIADLVMRRALAKNDVFVDVGSGYGIFLEEVARLGLFRTVIGIEPAPNMVAVCRGKGFRVIDKPLEAVEPGEVEADVTTCFEVLEHVFSPAAFLRAFHHVLRENGVLLFTTLTISGFDLQVLWSKSKSIYPPHHINLISVEGMRRLVESVGFRVLELSTPGKLDVDIVINAIREDPGLDLPRFVRHLVDHRDGRAHQAFQTFLQENNLSSHIRCVARRQG